MLPTCHPSQDRVAFRASRGPGGSGAVYTHSLNGRAIETLVETQGIDGQYESIPQRKTCCEVRKVAPLRRALEGASAWVTGLRSDQSANRNGTAFVAPDPSFPRLRALPCRT